MAVVRYADRYQCDSCGAEADGRPLDGSFTPWTLPEGWLSLSVSVPTDKPVPFRPVQVCDGCAALPFGDVVRKLASAPDDAVV